MSALPRPSMLLSGFVTMMVFSVDCPMMEMLCPLMAVFTVSPRS